MSGSSFAFHSHRKSAYDGKDYSVRVEIYSLYICFGECNTYDEFLQSCILHGVPPLRLDVVFVD